MRTILLTTAVATLPFAASAASIMIDDFNTRQIVSDNPVEPDFPAASEMADPNVIGGYRELQVETFLSGGPFATSLGSNSAGQGLLRFSNQSQQQGLGTVTYDGQDSSGLGGIDLAMGATDSAFRFTLADADMDLTLGATVTDTAGGTSMLERTFPRELVGSTINLAFADFMGDADFSMVNSIAFSFTGPEDLDASVGKIEAVGGDTPAPIPVPASAALLGTGLLGFAALRRRRKV